MVSETIFMRRKQLGLSWTHIYPSAHDNMTHDNKMLLVHYKNVCMYMQHIGLQPQDAKKKSKFAIIMILLIIKTAKNANTK